MNDTREMLQKHPSSVILIQSTLADAVGFKQRKWDLDMRKEKLSIAGAGDQGQRETWGE